MIYVIDTNILVHLVRENKRIIEDLETYFNQPNSSVYFSIVTRGEIKSLALQNNWGFKKRLLLEKYLADFIQINIDNYIVEAYAEMDAFSQCKHPTMPIPEGLTARNMGKNDLWIAATTYILNATLITTDKDFAHLDGFFFKIHSNIQVKMFYNSHLWFCK